MSRSTAPAHPPVNPEPATHDIDPLERLDDLRRRRTDLVEVLVETLFARIAHAPIGARRPPQPAREASADE